MKNTNKYWLSAGFFAACTLITGCSDDFLKEKQDYTRVTSEIYNKKLDYRILKNWMIRLSGLIHPEMKETIELLYRYKTDYIFDSSKFRRRFPDYRITTYQEGILEIIEEIKQLKQLSE